MYPSASWSRYQQQRRAEAEALEATVGDEDDFPPFHHRQDATTRSRRTPPGRHGLRKRT